jgi:hypothetical protein
MLAEYAPLSYAYTDGFLISIAYFSENFLLRTEL